MKTALHDFFDKYVEMWKSFSGTEPRIAFDDLERKEKVYVAESLKEFIVKISFSR